MAASHLLAQPAAAVLQQRSPPAAAVGWPAHHLWAADRLVPPDALEAFRPHRPCAWQRMRQRMYAVMRATQGGRSQRLYNGRVAHIMFFQARRLRTHAREGEWPPSVHESRLLCPVLGLSVRRIEMFLLPYPSGESWSWCASVCPWVLCCPVASDGWSDGWWCRLRECVRTSVSVCALAMALAFRGVRSRFRACGCRDAWID